MPLDFHREAISDGVFFTSVTDSRFKTNYISVNLITSLKEETAAMNAVIADVITRSNASYPSVTEINKKLTALYGASLGGHAFCLGDSQCVTLAGSCIADAYTLDGEKITGELADLLLECIFSPSLSDGGFSEKNFLLNKQELLDDIDAEINEKRSYAFLRAGKTIFAGEPAAISKNGERAYAEKLDAKATYRHYLQLLKKSRIEIMFSGGGNPSEAYEKFKAAFLKAEREYADDISSAFSPVKDAPAQIDEKLDVVQCKMVMAFKSSYDNIPAIKLMNSIFGQTPFSKLFMNVREKLSLCYYCSSSYNRLKGVLFVDSGVEQPNLKKAEDEIIRQFKEVAAGNFTEEEMENSLLSLINIHVSFTDSPVSLAKWYLNQAYLGTCFTPEEEIEKLRAVTREEIIEAAASFKLDTVYTLSGKEEK